MVLFRQLKKEGKVNLRLTLVLFATLLFGVLKVNAASNPYNKNYGDGINCTWFAWQQSFDKAGVELPSWGNANTWFDSAKKAGYETGMTPRVNSIVVWQFSIYGHVGYVERVYGNNIYVWDSVHPDGCSAEMPDLYQCWDNHTLEEVDNGACDGVSTSAHGCPYSKNYWHNEGDLIGYIYLDNALKKPIASVTSQNKVTNTQPKKSNNASLSSLKINNIDFEFDKDILEYNLEVKNSIEKINIEVTTEHDKAKVEGTGEKILNVGENILNIVVSAEDGTEKTYIIKIKRKDNNAYLDNLTISNVEFEFDKDIFSYEFQVARDMESVSFEGKAESELATIEGLGTHELLDEKNTINIIVTAEDNTINTYTITLKKEPIVEKPILKKKMNIWMLVWIGIAVVGVITILIIFIIKTKTRKIN